MTDRVRSLRDKLAAGRPALGTWLTIPSPMVAEIVSGAGFDWVLVESEHGPMNRETLYHILLAFRGSETVPLIRVPWNDPVMIKQALDMGYEGVLTPQTNSVDGVRAAVTACRYPPVGRRGAGWMLPSRYGRDGGAYVRTANERIICAVQIESVQGAAEIDEMVRVPGLDWILIGPRDMSGTVGEFNNVRHPDLQAAIRKILIASRNAGIPAGIALDGPDDLEYGIEAGNQLFAVGADADYLQKGVDACNAAFEKTIRGRSTNIR